MNCILICIFNQDKYVEMSLLLLESILLHGCLQDNTDILIYTSTEFMNMIKNDNLFSEKIKFEINDTYDTIDKACKSRYDIFNFSCIDNYDKILYLDTDILIRDDINKVFDICNEELLYVVEEGNIDSDTMYWGKNLFEEEVNDYEDKSAFNSGILLFKNCQAIKELFYVVQKSFIDRQDKNTVVFDQPYIIYYAFKHNIFNNKILNSLAVNNDYNFNSDKVIHHFPGGPGYYVRKLEVMKSFLKSLNDNKTQN